MFLSHRYFTSGGIFLNPCPSLAQSRNDTRESDGSLDSYEAVATEEKRRPKERDKGVKRRELEAHDDSRRRKQEGGCCDCALCRCLRRVPYGTLFAILLLAGGLALLTYETLTIRGVAHEMFFAANININSVLYEGTGTLFWVLISAVAIMGLFGLLLLVFACLTSGPSGQNTCGQERTRCIGLCSTDILIMVTYVVCAVWIALTVVLAMPFTFMLMVRSYCKNVTPTSCIDLSHYGLSGKVAKTSPNGSNTTALSVCGASLTDFCDKNGSIWLSSFLAMTACILIVIALIHFLMALSANHTYQKMLSGDQPTRTKYGNDYRRAYGDADIPLQEPLNIHDESTRF